MTTIVAIISSMAIVYNKLGERQITLYIETQKISEMIFRAKALALATYNQNPPPLNPSCGYGLEINYQSGQYDVFSYEPPVSQGCAISQINTAYRTVLGAVEMLHTDLAFDNVPPDALYAVLFVPPEPRVLMSSQSSGNLGTTPLKIYLVTKNGSLSTVISVNLAGQINF